MNDHSAMDMPINENLKASQFTIGKYFLVDFYCFGPGTNTAFVLEDCPILAYSEILSWLLARNPFTCSNKAVVHEKDMEHPTVLTITLSHWILN